MIEKGKVVRLVWYDNENVDGREAGNTYTSDTKSL